MNNIGININELDKFVKGGMLGLHNCILELSDIIQKYACSKANKDSLDGIEKSSTMLYVCVYANNPFGRIKSISIDTNETKSSLEPISKQLIEISSKYGIPFLAMDMDISTNGTIQYSTDFAYQVVMMYNKYHNSNEMDFTYKNGFKEYETSSERAEFCLEHNIKFDMNNFMKGEAEETWTRN